MEVGETHATSSQLVENRCLDGTVVAADVAVAKIVDVERDDIGTLLSRYLSNQSRSHEKLKDEQKVDSMDRLLHVWFAMMCRFMLWASVVHRHLCMTTGRVINYRLNSSVWGREFINRRLSYLMTTADAFTSIKSECIASGKPDSE